MFQATAAIHKHPLPPEWSEKAKKEIKGADPAEKLMWHTPEVGTFKYLLLVCDGVEENSLTRLNEPSITFIDGALVLIQESAKLAVISSNHGVICNDPPSNWQYGNQSLII